MIMHACALLPTPLALPFHLACPCSGKNVVATPREIELAAHYIVDRFGVKVMQEEVEGEGENRVEAAEVRGGGCGEVLQDDDQGVGHAGGGDVENRVGTAQRCNIKAWQGDVLGSRGQRRWAGCTGRALQ